MKNLYLREATYEDSKAIFEWANELEVRSNSFSSDQIDWENHTIWFNNKIKSKKSKILILTNGELNFGQIRIDNERNYWLIDYSIDKKYRGSGYGKLIVELLIRKYNELNLRAIVKAINKPSIKVFEYLNFSKKNQVNEQLICFEKIYEN